MLVGTEPPRIVSAVTELLGCATAYQAMACAPNPFGDGRASERIVEIMSQCKSTPYASLVSA